MQTEKILEGLNPDQQIAVRHSHEQEGPLLILAGAGSGKTAVLTRRIQWLVIHEQIDPGQILALTFTAKAAAEMRERVAHALGALAKEIRLCTFHSLALGIVREFWRVLGFAQSPAPSEQAAQHWEERILASGMRPGSLQREKLFAPANHPRQERGLLQLRQNTLKSGQLAFEDLIWLAIRVLEEQDEICAEVRARYRCILVDEYQDIDPAQYRLVRLLLGDSPHLFVVGDDDQAIYGFRGADIGNILRFRRDYPQCKVLKLEWNYRSTSAVLAVANRIFRNKDPVLRKRLRSGNARQDPLFVSNAPVQVWRSEYAREELDRIHGTMEELRSQYGLSWGDFAILVRYNRQREWFECALQSRAIEGVKVETIHAAKGLQYPVVFYAGLAKGISPGQLRGSRRQKRAQREEERRLFYVAVTRAEARLYLLFCARRHWHGGLRTLKESQYLAYAQEHSHSTLFRSFVPMIPQRILIFLRVILYMALALIEYMWLCLLRKESMRPWLEAKLEAWTRYCLRILSIRLEVEGAYRIAQVDWNRPVIVIANHSSYTDIPIVLCSLERKLGFVAKQELGRIPFLGYWMKQIGCLMIQRGKAGVGQAVNDAIRQMPQAPNLVIFPEGTRSRDGQLAPFKSGAFRMACDHRGVIIPLVIQGSRASWENRRNKEFYPTRCEILDPIDCAQFPDASHKELMAIARERMLARLQS